MHADLMGAAGLEFRIEQAEARKLADQPEYGMGIHPLLVHHHAPFAFRRNEFVQGQADVAFAVFPVADHQGQVVFYDLALPELLVQAGQGASFLGQHQDAGGIAVEPVNQFQEAQSRSGMAHLFDHAAGNTAAAMHGHAARLVDHQQVFVLEQDGPGKCRDVRPDRRLRRPDRGQPDAVARLNPVSRVHAAAVYPNFAASQNPVNMAFWHAFQDFVKIIVDALVPRLLLDLPRAYRSFA